MAVTRIMATEMAAALQMTSYSSDYCHSCSKKVLPSVGYGWLGVEVHIS